MCEIITAAEKITGGFCMNCGKSVIVCTINGKEVFAERYFDRAVVYGEPMHTELVSLVHKCSRQDQDT